MHFIKTNFIVKNSFKLMLCGLLVAGLGLSGCGSAGTKGPVIADPGTDTTDPTQKQPKKPGDKGPISDPVSPTPSVKIELEDVFFDYNRYTITYEGRAILKENARALSADPYKKVEIQGHCDERGTEEYNIALGDRRAQAVKKYLKNLGVSSSRMTTRSFGEQKPFCYQSNESCWQENRRGHFVLR